MRRSVAGVLLSSLMVLSLAMPAAAQSESPPEWSDAVSAGGWWEDQITDIAVDPSSGDILVVGAFHYDMYLGPFYLTSVQHATAGNTSDIFVAKLSGSEWKWAVSAGGEDYDWASSIAVDSSGDAYITGGFRSNNSTFDPFVLTNADHTPRVWGQSEPTSDGFVAKIDAEGFWQWAERISGNMTDEGSQVSVGPNDQIVVSGVFSSTAIQFGGGKSLINTGSPSSTDIFVIKFDSNGTHLWDAQVMGWGNEVVNGMAIHGYGDVMLTGYFTDQAAYFTPYKAANSKTGHSEAFVARLSPSGFWSWVIAAGGGGGDEGKGIDVDSNGNSYLIGRFSSDAIEFRDADNNTSTKVVNTVQTGSTDVFVAKVDGAGNWLWAVGIEGDGTDYAGGITVVDDGAVVAGGFYSLNYVFGSTTLQHSAAASHADMYVAGISENGTWNWAISGGMAGWPEYFALEHHDGSIHVAGSFSVGKATLGEHDMHNWDENSSFQWPDAFVATLEFPPPVPGCTDSLATNYDSNADVDDGSCEYAPDTDGDGIRDDVDTDDDGDGYTDDREEACGSDPLDPQSVPSDNDEDGFCDDLDDDDDDDGLLDDEEASYGADPLNPDSDGDGHMDGDEVDGGYDPMDPDDFARPLCCGPTPFESLFTMCAPVIVLLFVAVLIMRSRKHPENE